MCRDVHKRTRRYIRRKATYVYTRISELWLKNGIYNMYNDKRMLYVVGRHIFDVLYGVHQQPGRMSTRM
jgi:hypothetical protein